MIKKDKQKLIFGTASINQKYGIFYKKNNKFKILEKVIDNGIRSFDTAIDYNNDKILNKLFKHINSEPIIYTKFNLNDFGQNIIDKIEKHVENLGIIPKYFLFRELKKKTRFEKVVDFISNNYKNSLLGVSIYDKNDLRFFNNFDIDIIQHPYNLLNPITIKKKKKEKFIARSIFLQGILLSKSELTIKNKMTLLQINKFRSDYHSFLKEKNLNSLNINLSFCFDNKKIDKFIFSVMNEEELDEIINFKYCKFSEYKEIFSIINKFERKYFDPRNW